MIWLNFLIVAVLIWAIIIGYLHGGADIAIDTIGLIVATIMAILAARLLGNRLGRLIPALHGLTPVIVFGVVWIATLLLVMPLHARLHRRLPPGYIHSLTNRILGAVLNAIRVTIIITIALLVLVSLPLSAHRRTQIANSSIPRVLIAATGSLGNRVQTLTLDTFGSSLGFFATTGRDETSIPLNFTTTAGVPDPAQEAQLLSLVNGERTKQHLEPLKANDALRDVARAHAQDMLAKGYFAHVNKDNQDPFDRLRAAKIRFYFAGENLALAPTLRQAHFGLMNSPPHRANILSGNYGQAGIAVIDAGKYGVMVVQEFTN